DHVDGLLVETAVDRHREPVAREHALEPLDLGKLLLEGTSPARYLFRVGPGDEARVREPLPRKARAGIELALRRDVAVADDALRPDAVALDDVLRQRDDDIDLRIGIRLPIAELGSAVHDLDPDR